MPATKTGRDHTIVSCVGLAILILFMVMPIVVNAGAPVAPGTNNTMMKSTGIVHEAFQRPATPQDLALVQSVSTRLESTSSTKAQSTAPAGPADPGSVRGRKVPVFHAGLSVTVDARNGHVRLSGSNLTQQQRVTVDSVVKGTPGVMSWDWGN